MAEHTPEVEYVTPDARPPFTVRRMKNGPTHIVARDGFTIIATINQDRDGNAEQFAAAPQLLVRLKARRADCTCEDTAPGEAVCFSCKTDAGIISKAEGK